MKRSIVAAVILAAAVAAWIASGELLNGDAPARDEAAPTVTAVAEPAAGEVIARLDMEDRAARMAEARARGDQRQLEYDAVRRLSEKGYRAKTKFAEATALLESALASVARMEHEIDDT